LAGRISTKAPIGNQTRVTVPLKLLAFTDPAGPAPSMIRVWAFLGGGAVRGCDS